MAADVAVGFLLENLKQIAQYYANLLGNAKTELELLQGDLSSLNAFLKEVAKKPKKQEPLREMEKQIRKVVYEVEDIIDSCLTEAIAESSKKSVGRKLVKHLNPKRVSLAKQVKDARAKVNPMLNDARTKFADMPAADPGDEKKPIRSAQHEYSMRRENIVGFNEEETKIFDFLMDSKDELDVFSIVGMPGLGKTTLAGKVFRRKDVQIEFPVCIWVYVSQELSIRDVYLKIMNEFTQADLSRLNDEKLADEVRKALASGKFILVVDDVWDTNTWKAIEDVLTKSNGKGKVLLTTRFRIVGERASGSGKSHHLRFLNESESWMLLQYEVFKKLDVCPAELERAGRRIADQCDGLPLAIVVIGGILFNHLDLQGIPVTLSQWERISENVSTYVQQHDQEKRASRMVELSYNKLPDELRDCFLYVGVFPEDYEIPAHTLMNLWIAEGFIQQKKEESLEETAKEYLKDLINRNLVMVDKMNPRGEVKKCRMHDVIREFCHSKAALEEQNLYQEIKLSKDGVFFPPVNEIHKHRRLCIHFHLAKFLSEKNMNPQQNARSFLCFYKEPDVLLAAKYISSIPSNFKLLRVLDSNSFKFTHFPEKVAKLIHLRYLTLFCENLDRLPELVSELWNLQTLTIDTKSRELVVETNIWRMIQLRHLNTKAAIRLAIKGPLGQEGKNLQTMGRLSPENCTPDVFNRACNLKKLGIRGQIATLLDPKYSLVKLDHLENLKLVNDLFYESTSENPMRGLPGSNFFPQNLKMLTLSATNLAWTHMSTLAKIETLQVLKLKNKAFHGYSWSAVGNGFPSLHFLLISETDLVYWEATPEYFPKLGGLVINNCRSLQGIPAGTVKCLKKLEIDQIRKSVVECAKKIEEEKAKEDKLGGFKLTIGLICN